MDNNTSNLDEIKELIDELNNELNNLRGINNNKDIITIYIPNRNNIFSLIYNIDYLLKFELDKEQGN